MSEGATYDWTLDCVQGDDGVWIFWPTENAGAYPAHLLRTIANHIDKLNSENSMGDNYPSRLWNHMSETHNLHLLCSEEADIRNCVIEDSQAQLEEALKERDEFRAMAEDLLEKNAKQAVEIIRFKEASK